MTNSRANEIHKSYESGIRIDETSRASPDWQSDYDGGGLGIAEATNIRTYSAYRAIKDSGGLMKVREGLEGCIFYACHTRSQVNRVLRKNVNFF
jgi:hypothetical protein